MRRLCLSFVMIFWALLPLLLMPPVAQAAEVKVNYTANKVEYIKAEGLYRLSGNVDLKVRDIEIKTEELEYDVTNKILRSNVDFEMIQTPKDEKPRTLKGKSFAYQVDLRRIEAQEIYLVIPAQKADQEVYIQGDWMTAYNDGERVVIRNGFFTTCNHYQGQLEDADEDPYSKEAVRRRATHYAIEAEILDYIKDQRVLAWNAQILTFENNAFWFPFWYMPLESPAGFSKPDIDAGQNPIEGVFAKFKGYYKWNEYHDGYWYLSTMEKKGIGIGFQHDWIAYPNSITRTFFYGIPLTKDLLSLPGSIFSIPNLAESLEQQQLGTQQLNIGNPSTGWDWIGRYLSDKFKDHEFDIHHRQLLLPHLEADIAYKHKDMYSTSGYTAQRNPQSSFDLSLKDVERFLLDPYSELELNTSLDLNQSINSPQNLEFDAAQNLVQTNRISQNQSRKADIRATLDKSDLSISTNWSDNFNQTVRRTLSQSDTASPQPSATPTPQSQSQEIPTGNENWNTTLGFNTAFDEKTKLNANVVYNSNVSGIGTTSSRLNQTLQPRIKLTQDHDWGGVAVNYEDFFDLSPVQDANRSSGQIKKLPELDLNFKPLLQDFFPIQLDTTIGRYFDPSSVVAGSSLNEIGRSRFRISLSSKDYDLGLGNKVNFGGTNFEQRFYQTLDAEYIFTGQVNYRNELTPFFIPNFSYQRAVQDLENNNSPFQNFEPLGLRLVNNLNVDLRFVNLPEFTMNFTGGYDYLNRRYQPIRANITSELGNQFALRANSSYTPINITDADVGQMLKDSQGNVYHHGDPVNGPTFTIRPQDVGSFSPYGGQWGITTVGMRWRNTDQELYIGNLNTFGLDSGIPEGFELGGDIAYDFHQGKINGLNTLLRFKLGSSWQWHTEIDLIASVQPTTLPKNAEEFFALEIPFNIVVRKDLHDFILTASWNSFNQQFNINLQLLAFPYSTDQLLGNVGSLGQQLNSMGGIR